MDNSRHPFPGSRDSLMVVLVLATKVHINYEFCDRNDYERLNDVTAQRISLDPFNVCIDAFSRYAVPSDTPHQL